jgi:16S rRNA methyltransferase gidB
VDKNNKMYDVYRDYLLEVNSHTNLTTITDPSDIRVKHFDDSLSIIDYINEGSKVLDIGSGAGFPGIPLRIEKNFDLTLIDSVNKKVKFMNEVIEKLELKNTRAIHTRAEDFAKNERETYDLVISRAVANMSTLSELCIPFLKVGGLFIAMKGPKADEELEEAENALKVLGGEIIKLDRFDLDGNERVNIIVRKTHPTKIKYPRGKNLPKKNPL